METQQEQLREIIQLAGGDCTDDIIQNVRMTKLTEYFLVWHQKELDAQSVEISAHYDEKVKKALIAQLDRLEKLNNHTYEEWFASLHDGDGNVTNKDSSARFDPRGNVAKEIKALRAELGGE